MAWPETLPRLPEPPLLRLQRPTVSDLPQFTAFGSSILTMGQHTEYGFVPVANPTWVSDLATGTRRAAGLGAYMGFQFERARAWISIWMEREETLVEMVTSVDKDTVSTVRMAANTAPLTADAADIGSTMGTAAADVGSTTETTAAAGSQAAIRRMRLRPPSS
uniref:Uncharacterized protein n=1 Tax=Oryza glaberrima TaxID=4538 RepID=I1Q991_ORYGL